MHTAASRTDRSRRGRGERGVAIIMTGLLLVPLLVFAAFGVDIASWHARIAYLQKAADAAALAGAVWMPNLDKATNEAKASLRENGLVDRDDPGGMDNIEIDITRGSTPTSLKVTVTDTDAARYFSQIIYGRQSLSRSGEAEYHLPIPLGSPLNYFGGYHWERTINRGSPGTPAQYSVAWPNPVNDHQPARVFSTALDSPAQNFPCRVSATVNAGRWTSQTNYSSGNGTGGACYFSAIRANSGSGSWSEVPPPDYSTRAPDGSGSPNPCRVRQGGDGQVIGRWNNGSFSTTTTGSGGTCRWRSSNTTRLDPRPGSGLSATWYRTTPPINQPCRVGWSNDYGRWASNAWASNGDFVGLSASAGNRLCRWAAQLYESAPAVPPQPDTSPIDPERSPNFWAMIFGPGQYAANGDPYSSECLSSYDCTNIVNRMHEPASDQNRGFWYVVDVPPNGGGPIDINVFDASLNFRANQNNDRYIDRYEGSMNDVNFVTEYRVYKQENLLDYTIRTPLGSTPSNNVADGGCWWRLTKEAEFHGVWAKLCTINASGGDRYLVNVQTSRAPGARSAAGNNGYALEAVLGGCPSSPVDEVELTPSGTRAFDPCPNRHRSDSPSLYALGSMGMFNNNAPGVPAEFYLAKVPKEHAGKKLVISLYDAGDGVQTSSVYPLRPEMGPAGALPSTPNGLVPVPRSVCTWSATADPNPVVNGQQPGEGGSLDSADRRNTTGHGKTNANASGNWADGSNCGVKTAISNNRQFNGTWLEIVVDIPPADEYQCDETINRPWEEVNSCWWGIRYDFGGNATATDETTWRARIQGNPLQLIE